MESTKSEEEVNVGQQQLKDRKVSWAKLGRVDSLNMEAGKVSSTQARHGSKVCGFIVSIYVTLI